MALDTLKVNKVAGGQRSRNFTLHITGVVTEKDFLLTPLDLELEEKQLKLSSAVWLVQEKMGLYLWWDKETILLPMESRNSVRFDTTITSPPNWDGRIYLSSFGFAPPKKVFFLVLDFDR